MNGVIATGEQMLVNAKQWLGTDIESERTVSFAHSLWDFDDLISDRLAWLEFTHLVQKKQVTSNLIVVSQKSPKSLSQLVKPKVIFSALLHFFFFAK